MPKIPLRGDPTLDAVKIAIENQINNQKPRDYIGASGIGHECSRKLWYAYNKYPRNPINWKSACAIEDGHRTEDLMADRLRMVKSVELHTHKEDGSQYGFDIGFMKGHYDGVICGLLQAPKTWHIWENKCVNEKKFKEFKKLKNTHGEKGCLEQWDYIYYCQAILYMHFENMDRHYLTVETSGGRDMDSCRTEANKSLAEALIAKAERIHKAKEPPERIGGKDFYVCKWCEFYEECHSV